MHARLMTLLLLRQLVKSAGNCLKVITMFQASCSFIAPPELQGGRELRATGNDGGGEPLHLFKLRTRLEQQ